MTEALEAIRAQLQATRAQLQAASAYRPRRPLPVLIHEPERPAAVWMAPIASVSVDPARFQFRAATAEAGTCGRLKGCERFNPALAGALLVWRSEGQTHLIDGHHRLELARRSGVEAVAVLAIEARTDREARLTGAMANLAAGQAGAIELARLLRDDPSLKPWDLVAGYGIKRNTRPLTDAATLRALSPALFTDAAIGLIPLDHALALAAAPDPALQAQLWAQAQRRQWDPGQLLEAAELAQLGAHPQAVTGCLPGLEDLLREGNPRLDQLLAVRAAVRGQLRLERRAGAAVAVQRAAEALERTGAAAVDQARAREVKHEAQALLDRFAALAGCSGQLAGLLNRMAAEVADGQDLRRVVDRQMPEVRAVLSAELS